MYQHPDPARLREIAEEIVSGNTSSLPAVEYDLLDYEDWVEAAEMLIEGGDYATFLHFWAREIAYNEFCEWQYRVSPKGEYADFDNWIDSQCGWSRQEPYYTAMVGRYRQQYDAFLDKVNPHNFIDN